MTPPIIRPARSEDLPSLTKLARETFIDAFTDVSAFADMRRYVQKAFAPEQIEKEFATPGSRFLVVDGVDGLIGYMKLNQGPGRTVSGLTNAVEMQRLYVHRSAQGLGIGKALLNKARQIVAKEGGDWIWLAVWGNNKGGIRFYQRGGFTQYSTLDFPLGSVVHHDLMMRLAASP